MKSWGNRDNLNEALKGASAPCPINRQIEAIERLALVFQQHVHPQKYDGVMDIETAAKRAALGKVLSMSAVAAADGNRPGQ